VKGILQLERWARKASEYHERQNASEPPLPSHRSDPITVAIVYKLAIVWREFYQREDIERKAFREFVVKIAKYCDVTLTASAVRDRVIKLKKRARHPNETGQVRRFPASRKAFALTDRDKQLRLRELERIYIRFPISP
jgi:hypothetical protein